MAEGARLESVYTFTGIGGSNPSLSAILFEMPATPAKLLSSKERPKTGPDFPPENKSELDIEGVRVNYVLINCG